MSKSVTLETLQSEVGFKPNANQKKAIEHTSGPLFLSAGPGSGKTRVLLWRTVNLIVFHGIKPEEIILTTFTEKAAKQLKDGLTTLLSLAANRLNRRYDISRMYVGTIHSLSRKIITDRRFAQNRRRNAHPIQLDDLDQFLFVYNRKRMRTILDAGGYADKPLNDTYKEINVYLGEVRSKGSRNALTARLLSAFNRFSEESFDPDTMQSLLKKAKTTREDKKMIGNLINIYAAYLNLLAESGPHGAVDFSLLQKKAYSMLSEDPAASRQVFKHIIVDEYQDTNYIQEKIFFHLAGGHKNICVVGDDDQALYRFRGATVENLVQFETRVRDTIKTKPTRIDLNTNYRSRSEIVEAYSAFMDGTDWSDGAKKPSYFRIMDKKIVPHRADKHSAVVCSAGGAPEDVYAEIAEMITGLLQTKKIKDPNQVAFLFPSLTSTSVPKAIEALRNVGLEAYAPRAGSFLQLQETQAILGLFARIFGYEAGAVTSHPDYIAILNNCLAAADALLAKDAQLRAFVKNRQAVIQEAVTDLETMTDILERHGWTLDQIYDHTRMMPELVKGKYSSAGIVRTLKSARYQKFFGQGGKRTGTKLKYIVTSLTSLDWGVLDLFYQLLGFDYFRKQLQLAEDGTDEGPICNYGLISQYLGRYADEWGSILNAHFLSEERFVKHFFGSYFYILHRRGESEYENAEDPFPKGRVPFLTVHQSKGLEFPVVVLGSMRKDDHGYTKVEEIVRLLAPERQGEPLERMAKFDIMRMYYVALSRAENLLVLPVIQGQGHRINGEFKTLMDAKNFASIADLDLSTVPAADDGEAEMPSIYSYTGDYSFYNRCPRQYMIFKKYGFVPSRSQTGFYGNLVHHTLEDLHNELIRQREVKP